MRHLITISPTDREDRYRVSGAISIPYSSSPIPDAALDLKAAGHPESDSIVVSGTGVTVLPVRIGSILSARPTPNRVAMMRNMIGLSDHR